MQHEPSRKLLGQRGGGKLLRNTEDGAALRASASDPTGHSGDGGRLHRALLQHPPSALVTGLPESGRVRAEAPEPSPGRGSLKPGCRRALRSRPNESVYRIGAESWAGKQPDSLSPQSPDTVRPHAVPKELGVLPGLLPVATINESKLLRAIVDCTSTRVQTV